MTLRTIARAIEDAASATRNGFRFVDDATGAEPFFSFGGVERATGYFGGALQAAGLEKGDRVALVLPDNQDFVFAFLGAIRAGLVPVPIYPPAGLRKLDGYLESTLHVVARSGARALITDRDIKPLLGTVKARAPSLRAVLPVDTLRQAKVPLRPVSIGLEDTAFLQFTSGSTSAPKGVVITHANVAHNVEAFMKGGIRVEDGVDSGVSWLPLYHDMGLIGFVLGPLYHRNTITFLPPFAFLKRPVRWLEAISRHRATISFGPNFAYALCCKRIKDSELAGLDLSSWRVAGCGAEPIRAANLEAFAERFARVGFDRRALMPSYGMAESTLAVSFAGVGTGFRTDEIDADVLVAEGRAIPLAGGTEVPSDRVARIVSCGHGFEGHEVRAFAPDDAASSSPLPDRTVGELRLRGPSVMGGYFDAPGQTREAFAGDWLKTGDLGYLVEGEVFVCGRTKELIIVNGRNFYPQDLEWETSKLEGVRKGNVVAFGTRKPLNDRERVVLCLETGLSDAAAREALKAEVRRVVQQATGLAIDDVVAVDAGVLPKTSSGKLKRAETRDLYETGRLFLRTPDREGDEVGTARDLATSQLGYLRDALFGGKPRR